jgi:hypothetical protein
MTGRTHAGPATPMVGSTRVFAISSVVHMREPEKSAWHKAVMPSTPVSPAVVVVVNPTS